MARQSSFLLSLLFASIAATSFLVTRQLRQPQRPERRPAPTAGGTPSPVYAAPESERRGRPSRTLPTLASPAVEVDVSDLDRLVLDDRRAALLRSTLVNAIGERVLAAPPCRSPREPGSLLRVELHLVTTQGSVTVEHRALTVAEGAPLSPESIACIESRLSPNFRFAWPDPRSATEVDSPLEFDGTAVVHVALGRPLA
jgi:hypothetical protein